MGPQRRPLPKGFVPPKKQVRLRPFPFRPKTPIFTCKNLSSAAGFCILVMCMVLHNFSATNHRRLPACEYNGKGFCKNEAITCIESICKDDDCSHVVTFCTDHDYVGEYLIVKCTGTCGESFYKKDLVKCKFGDENLCRKDKPTHNSTCLGGFSLVNQRNRDRRKNQQRQCHREIRFRNRGETKKVLPDYN